MEMDFSLELFIHAIEKNRENSLWDMWSLQYPLMRKETYVSFENYKKTSITQKTTKISYEDIQKEMDAVIKNHEERR